MTEFKKGMWVMVAWGGKGNEHPALVMEVRDNGLEIIDLGVNQLFGVPFDWATPIDLPRICNDDGQPLMSVEYGVRIAVFPDEWLPVRPIVKDEVHEMPYLQRWGDSIRLMRRGVTEWEAIP